MPVSRKKKNVIAQYSRASATVVPWAQALQSFTVLRVRGGGSICLFGRCVLHKNLMHNRNIHLRSFVMAQSNIDSVKFPEISKLVVV